MFILGCFLIACYEFFKIFAAYTVLISKIQKDGFENISRS